MVTREVSNNIGGQEEKEDVTREVSKDRNASGEESSSGSNELSDFVIIT